MVIVGGGITGLSAALELDGGAESFITRKPEAYKLAQELGLEVLDGGAETKGMFLLRDQEILGVPTNPLAFLASKLLSGKSKLRALQEPWTRGAASQTDESLGTVQE